MRLFAFAFDGIFSFSSLPIRIWSLFGALVAVLSMGYGAYLVSRTIFEGVDIPGYASTIVAVLFIGGLNLFTMGILGEYIGRIMIETKRRPLFIVRGRYGRRDGAAEAPARRAPAKKKASHAR
jgi:glycosyltransferase involved in cell wall biosynthesis